MNTQELIVEIGRVCGTWTLQELISRISQLEEVPSDPLLCEDPSASCRESSPAPEKDFGIFFIPEREGAGFMLRSQREFTAFYDRVRDLRIFHDFLREYRESDHAAPYISLLKKMEDGLKRPPRTEDLDDLEYAEKAADILRKKVIERHLAPLVQSLIRGIGQETEDEGIRFFKGLADCVNQYLMSFGVFTYEVRPGERYAGDVVSFYEAIPLNDTQRGENCPPVVTAVLRPSYVIEYAEEDSRGKEHWAKTATAGLCVVE